MDDLREWRDNTAVRFRACGFPMRRKSIDPKTETKAVRWHGTLGAG